MTIGERLLILFVMIAVPLTFIGVPIFVFMGGIRKFALRPLQRRYVGIDLHESPQPGDVVFVYHTYRGFLVWFVQDEHRVVTSPTDAKLLLARLLRFNLTWGMLSYGVVFVPFIAIGNYYAQMKSIGSQIQTAATDTSGDEAA